MPQFRYLCGPVNASQARVPLAEERRDGRCLCFAAVPPADVVTDPRSPWPGLVAQLPAGWQPDCLLWLLDNGPAPPALRDVPVPTVALTTQWRAVMAAVEAQWPALRERAQARRGGTREKSPPSEDGGELMGLVEVCERFAGGGQWAEAAEPLRRAGAGRPRPAARP